MTVKEHLWFRASALIAMVLRHEMELEAESDPENEEMIMYFEQLNKSVDGTEVLWKSMTDQEKLLMRLLPGQWPEQEHIQYSWYVEALGCMLWALGEYGEMPNVDEKFDYVKIDSYFGNAGELNKPNWLANLLNRKVKIKTKKQIEYEKMRAEIVYQRSLFSWEVRDSRIKVPTKKYSEIFPFKKYGLPIGSSGDMMVFNKEFCDISYNEEALLCPMNLMRLQAFIWILDTSQNWDEVTVPGIDEFIK